LSLLPQPAVATDAVVLKTWPTGETSVVASLLTAQCGYLRVIAKGARLAVSALRPLVQPGRLVAIECGHTPGRELQFLRGGSVLLDPLAELNSLERTAHLLAAVELIERCRPAEESAAALCELCRDFLGMLSSAPPGRCAALFYAFELGLLRLHGLLPVLDECAVCGAPLLLPGAAGARFSPAAGGAVCGRCAAGGKAEDGRPLAEESLAALRFCAAAGGQPAEAASPWALREVGIALHRFLAYHLPGYRLPAGLDLLRAGRGGAKES
jgi:DNA repair protein RecO